jgi:periplasmic divalent cation tolerance protein
MTIVVFITCPDKKQADKIAKSLIKVKYAACVNLVSSINSLFWWKGKVDSCQEVLLVVKTKKRLFRRLERLVKSLHSYNLPEIIAVPVIAGSKEYLKWIDDSTR